MVFNTVVDVVLRHWKHVQGQETRAVDDRLTIYTVFYADDGKLSCWDHQEPQRGIELLTGMFARFGLHLNTKKTKVLVGCLGQSTMTCLAQHINDGLKGPKMKKVEKTQERGKLGK